MIKKMSLKNIQSNLLQIPQYQITSDHSWIFSQYSFNNWSETISFINKISKISENLNHHPNLHLGYGFCNVKIQTHDVKGITDLDFSLAKKINECFYHLKETSPQK